MTQQASKTFDWMTFEDDALCTMHNALVAYLNDPKSKREFLSNADKGHPNYTVADEPLEGCGVDGPETNRLYAIGHSIEEEVDRRSGNGIELFFHPDSPRPFKSWRSFTEAVKVACEAEHKARFTD